MERAAGDDVWAADERDANALLRALPRRLGAVRPGARILFGHCLRPRSERTHRAGESGQGDRW